MKKFLFGQMAVAMLLAVSCAKETGKESPQGSPVQVVFNVGLDQETATRAISDGTTVDRLTYLVCDGEGNAVGQKESVPMKDGSASARIQLTTGQSYTVYFWAQQGETYGLDRFPIVDIDYGNALNNDESRDAFYAAYKIENLRSQTQNVTLTRPFAQINFGVKGEAWADVSASSLTVLKGAYSVFDLSKDAVSGPVGPVVFADNAVPEETLNANGSDYTYLSMTYVLVDDKTPLDLRFDFGERNFTQENVAAKKNQRTNFLFGGEPTVSNGAVDEVGATEVTLTARFNNISTTHAPQEAWFAYGTDPNNLTSKKSYSGTLTSANGSFSVTLSSLSPATKYYYKACMTVWNGSGYVTIESETGQFTTDGGTTITAPGYLNCYEIPAVSVRNYSNGSETYGNAKYHAYTTDDSNQRIITHTYAYNGKVYRNYTCLVDKNKKAPLWSAFVMHKGAYPDNNVNRAGNWAPDPGIPENWQSNFSASGYSRGHFVASNYRQTDAGSNKQTFYYTNQALQYQTRFNDGIWNTLEQAVKSNAPSGARDTLYVVVGILYENNNTLQGVALPSHFYKCLMKCSFSTAGVMTDAKGCAYLFANEEHSNSNYASGITTIDEVEKRAGWDFFTHVPKDLQDKAEAQNLALW